jgi:hypothetical protein
MRLTLDILLGKLGRWQPTKFRFLNAEGERSLPPPKRSVKLHFHDCLEQLLKSTPLTGQCINAVYWEVRRPELEFHHTSLCSVVVKNEWRYNSVPHVPFVVWTGPILPFHLQFVTELKNFVIMTLQ